jgi:hypothetical protein
VASLPGGWSGACSPGPDAHLGFSHASGPALGVAWPV